MIYYKNLKKISFLFVIYGLLKFSGCSYSFTGASVPAHIKTVAITGFDDRSGSGEAGLSDSFTNELIQKFINDNTLQIADKSNTDSILEGNIVSLQDNISVVTGGEQLSSKKITITVKVIYRDLVKKIVVFDKNFSFSLDYSIEGDVVVNRQEAITKSIDKITEDILLGVVSNW